MKKFILLTIGILLLTVFISEKNHVFANCIGPQFCFDDGDGGGGTTTTTTEPEPEPEPPLQNGVIDLTNDGFGGSEYAVAEWKYDFSQLYENYQNSWNYNDRDEYFNYLYYYGLNGILDLRILPTVRNQNDDYYYMYKSQVIPYNPVLYSEIEMVINSYQIVVESMLNEYENLEDMYYDQLIEHVFNQGLDALSYIQIVDLIVEAMNDPYQIEKSCSIISSQVNESYSDYFKIVCVSVGSNVKDATQDAVMGYLADKNFIEIVSPLAQDIAIDILNKTVGHVISKYVPGLNVLVTAADIMSTYVLYEHYSELSNRTSEVLDSIESVIPMFKLAMDNPNFHLRMDYVVKNFLNSFPQYYLAAGSIDVEEEVRSLELAFDYAYTTGIFFSLTNIETIEEEWFPTYTQSNGASWTIRGNLSVYSADEFMRDLEYTIYEQTNLVPINIAYIYYNTYNFGTL